MSNPLEAKIECPFYITNTSKAIYCESCIADTENRFVFKTMGEKSSYIKDICSVNQGKKCLHYRAMMILYERGALNGNAD